MRSLKSTEYWGSRLAVLCSIFFPWLPMMHVPFPVCWHLRSCYTKWMWGGGQSWGQLRCPEACVCSSLENTAPHFRINTHCPHFSESALSASAGPWTDLHLAVIVYIYWGVRDSPRLLPSMLIYKPELKRKFWSSSEKKKTNRIEACSKFLTAQMEIMFHSLKLQSMLLERRFQSFCSHV